MNNDDALFGAENIFSLLWYDLPLSFTFSLALPLSLFIFNFESLMLQPWFTGYSHTVILNAIQFKSMPKLCRRSKEQPKPNSWFGFYIRTRWRWVIPLYKMWPMHSFYFLSVHFTDLFRNFAYEMRLPTEASEFECWKKKQCCYYFCFMRHLNKTIYT